MNNYQLSEKFSEMAVMCDYTGDNVFRSRAFLKAAEIIASLETELYEREDGFEIEGIGRGVKDIIVEFLSGGRSKAYDELKRSVPEDIFQMLGISGVGVKKLRALCEALGVRRLDELQARAENGEVRLVKGFSAAGEANIIREIARIKSERHSKLFFAAEMLFTEASREIRRLEGVVDICAAGEFARKLPVVKKLSCTVVYRPELSCEEISGRIIEALNSAESEISVCGDIAILTFPGFSSDFPAEFFLVRQCAASDNIKKLLALSFEYLESGAQKAGLSDGIAAKSENEYKLRLILSLAENFERLDFANSAPEHSEIAWKHMQPESFRNLKLFTADGVKGIFHVHSNYSDGGDSLETIVLKAKEAGLSYIGITDHSQSSSYAGGLSAERLLRQCAEIDALNAKYSPFKIFKGIECDILKDGTLDFPDNVLKTLDFVIVSVHSHFRMAPAEMSERIRRAVSNPFVTMLGHMTGRLLTKRKGYEVYEEVIFEAARKNNVIIELNSNPYRMDIDYRHFARLNELGIMISINPDSHSISDAMPCVKFGVNAVNLGAMPENGIFNAKSAEEAAAFFNSKKEAAAEKARGKAS